VYTRCTEPLKLKKVKKEMIGGKVSFPKTMSVGAEVTSWRQNVAEATGNARLSPRKSRAL